jgi:hypothetical protein
VTDAFPLSDLGAADPTTEAFWTACEQHRLLVQHCKACGENQFYPRPFCLSCESNDLEWAETAGKGTIYSLTTIRMPVTPELPPPYLLALVDLDEGPRLLTNIVGVDTATIGDRVELTWRARENLPPLPVFRPAAGVTR